MMKVGIDLGTTNSVIARLDEDGEPETIWNSDGNLKTPSVVQFRENQDFPLVGEPAERERVVNPEQTVSRVKRHMGDDWTTEILGKEYRPEEISARILRKLIDDAEQETGEEVEKAVITVPADFGIPEREATTDAARMAHERLEESDIELLTEPVAACLRYGIEKGGNETIFVYDMGGGTFDATIVEVDGEDFIVEGTEGGKRLGGEDFDDKLYQHVRDRLLEQGASDPENSEQFKTNVMDEVKQAKHVLSNAQEASVAVSVGPGEIIDITITREEFEDLTENLVAGSIDEVENLFDHENVDVTRDEIDRVLLAGGSTRIPAVQEAVEEYFTIEPSQDLEQDFVVGEGAAIQTERVNWQKDLEPGPKTQTVLPETIGVGVKDDDSGEMVFRTIMEKQRQIEGDGERESKTGFRKVDAEQTEVEVPILEGGEPLAEDNDTLGQVVLSNLESGSDPPFEIEFEVTSEARLTAEVTNMETGQTEDHTVEIGLDEIVVEKGIEEIGDESEEREKAITQG